METFRHATRGADFDNVNTANNKPTCVRVVSWCASVVPAKTLAIGVEFTPFFLSFRRTKELNL